MIEAMMIAMFAGLLSFTFAEIALPTFNQFLGLQLKLGIEILPWVIGLTFLVGVLSGSYPAFFLSHFQPVTTLKGGQAKSNMLRNGLVVFQFATSILLMIGTLTVYDQLHYVGNRDLGYNSDGLLSMSIFGRKPELRRTIESIDAVKNAFAQHPNVKNVTTMTWQNLLNPSRITVMPANKDTELSIYYFGTDSDFLDTYQVRLKAGRNIRKRNVIERGLENTYRSEKQTATLSFFYSALAIFVACLGLLGLATFAAEQRSKEIAIRKVLGASVASILGLLSSEFLKWIAWANLIAWPTAYFLMRQWLDSFAYRIELGIGVFVLAGALTLAIALLTVNVQTLKAARSNPADTLKYE